MPQRSNEFQRLIYLLHLQMHHRAKVTESAMVANRLGGAPQEVDVLIEEPIGQICMLIGVECRDHRRPVTIEWVQQMRGKHEHRTDKLILVSRSGFTDSAISEARRYGIETMGLLEATKSDWTVIVNRLKEVFVGQFNFHTSKGYAVLAENYGMMEDPIISPSEILFSSDGEELGQVGTIARQNLQHSQTAKELMNLFYENRARTQVTASFGAPPNAYLIDSLGIKRCVRSIKIEIECEMNMTPVSLQHGLVGTIHVAWGQASNKDAEFFFATIEQEGHPGSSVLRLHQKGDKIEQIIELRSDLTGNME